jgi:hypothetical protein
MTETTDRPGIVPAADAAPATLGEQATIAAIENDTAEPHADPAEPEDVVATAVPIADGEPPPPSSGQPDVPPGLGYCRGDGRPPPDRELEDGIATIFAMLHSAADGEHAAEADAGAGLAAADMSTFRLLGELDRLWHRAE